MNLWTRVGSIGSILTKSSHTVQSNSGKVRYELLGKGLPGLLFRCFVSQQVRISPMFYGRRTCGDTVGSQFDI